MDSLNETTWDVLIAGTGLQESLLALAFSRSGKKVLHVDRNDYYGGADATLSLQDAETWAKQHEGHSQDSSSFQNAVITSQPSNPAEDGKSPSLSFPRAYSLALSPHLIYAKSRLLDILVSAKVDQQLEFLAVGNWWIYEAQIQDEVSGEGRAGRLLKVPNGREDVFADQNLDTRAKRALMKFLRFLPDFENQTGTWGPHSSTPFPEFLSSKFGLPESVQQPLLALCMGSRPALESTTSFALPRIARHLRSIGFLGAGFGAVIPKWGGLAEVAQVACRAGAVGGGVYTLGNGIENLEHLQPEKSEPPPESSPEADISITLKNGDKVRTTWLIGSPENVPQQENAAASHVELPNTDSPEVMSRSVSIISAPLTTLFSTPPEGAPSPAVALAVFPPSSLDDASSPSSSTKNPPVYIMVHSSETGECPSGQSILYTSIALPRPRAQPLLARATALLLAQQTPPPSVLWTLQYEERTPPRPQPPPQTTSSAAQDPTTNSKIIVFPPPPLDLVFDDDAVVGAVERVWRRVVGLDAAEAEAGGFMRFERRDAGAAGYGDEEEDGGGGE